MRTTTLPVEPVVLPAVEEAALELEAPLVEAALVEPVLPVLEEAAPVDALPVEPPVDAPALALLVLLEEPELEAVALEFVLALPEVPLLLLPVAVLPAVELASALLEVPWVVAAPVLPLGPGLRAQAEERTTTIASHCRSPRMRTRPFPGAG